jgi:peptidoglycan/xylan/chitin deacetylase (PgdA/CDA1 family)
MAGPAAGAALRTFRADPTTARGLRLGGWFASSWRRRLLLGVLVRVAAPALALAARLGPRAGALAADAAYWRQVRAQATAAEWRRLTRSSYVALYYHRLAGEFKPGQERLDVSPEHFSAQLRLLRRLGFTALSPGDLIAFHAGNRTGLPRRAFVVTVDDGFQDCVGPLAAHAACHPQLFVPTDEVGGHAWWAGEEPVAEWGELRDLSAAGVGIGSHSSSHHPLDELDDDVLRVTLAASRERLEDELGSPVPILAYPHGRRDDRVLRVARECGFQLAFTTAPGRNGWGIDPMQLRRIGVKSWDTPASLLFKALAGEHLPPRWERRLARSAHPGSARPGPAPA